MRYRATSQSQRARRTLSQEAVKRSHRRCDLIRLVPENESATSSSRAVDTVEPIDAPIPTSSRA
ncbi:MAG: hypothetical protein P9F19_16525 [Candidatus Contendobacter sp.]|nr:hypothetical protein [Candidatus Contendobacter sp.]MDG4558971.1 hypothetical protein [Candidatus Contendobacter sp.]